MRVRLHGQARQLETRFGIEMGVLTFAVRRLVIRIDNDFVLSATHACFFGDEQMPEMNRIERATHQTDTHISHYNEAT